MKTTSIKSAFILLTLGIIVIVFLTAYNIASNWPESTTAGKKTGYSEFENQNKTLENNTVSGISEEYFLLPDIEVKPLENAFIETGTDGIRTLRFPGTFANVGDGPLEIYGTEKDGKTLATQRIYKKDGSFENKEVGSFILHPSHSHWHFENFVKFSIHSAGENNKLLEEKTATGKITYCIHDFAPLPEAIPGKPESAVYPWCTKNIATQGISVGWVDTYEATVPGQELTINGLGDGIYVFRTVADPDNLLLEKNEENNEARTFLEIKRNTVNIIKE